MPYSSPNGYFYLPVEGAKGTSELALYNAAQNAVDEVLGKIYLLGEINAPALYLGDGTNGERYIFADINNLANKPGLRYYATTSTWQFSQDGVTWYDFGATPISGDTGTTSDTFEINTGGFGLIIDTAGMTIDRTVLGEDLYQATQLMHNQNTDTGTTATSFEINTGGFGLTISAVALGVDRTVAAQDVYDAADQWHVQGTDLGLDTGGTNPITAATIKGHVDNVAGNPHGTDISQLDDVDLSSPQIDQALVYNGLDWINANIGNVSAGPATIFYLDNDAQDGAYQTLLVAPDTVTPEEDDSVVVNASEAFMMGFLYDTAIGGISIEGGVWEFHMYAYVSDASGVSTLILDAFKVVAYAGTAAITGTGTSRTAIVTGSTPFVAGDANADAHLASYLQTPNGTFQITAYTSNVEVTIATDNAYVNESGVAFTLHKVLFSVESQEINQLTTPLLYSFDIAQTDFSINTTDKLALRIYGKTTHTSNVTVHFTHNSTDHYSHFHAPIIARHNDLAGLQGGSAGERYHMTLAENGDLHTQNTDTGTDANTFAIGDGAAGNKVIQANNADGNKPALRYDDSNNVWQFANDGTTWQDMGSGGGGNVTHDVNQVAHGFAVGDVIRLSGSSYIKAQANSDTNAEVCGIVSAVAGLDDFTVQMAGRVTGLSGLTAGTVYYLSGATAGVLTATEPTTVGYISKPVILADSTTSGFFYNFRGAEVGAPNSYNLSFTNASLTAGVLTVNHALGVDYPNVTVYDNNKKVILPDDITSVTTNQLTIDLSSFGTITGTWYAVVLPVGNTAPAGVVATTGDQSVGGVKTFTSHPIFPATSNPANLLDNGAFEDWTAGTAFAPDGWMLSGSGASVARHASTNIGLYVARVTRVGNNCNISQQVTGGLKPAAYFRGRVVTLGCWVWATVADRGKIYLYDGVGSTVSAFHPGDSTWRFLTVTRTIDASATTVMAYFQIDAGDTNVYFDGAIMTEGETPYAFSPKTPEEGVWSNYFSQSTVIGWTSFSTSHIYIKKIGKTVFVAYSLRGTSNSTAVSFTLPYAAAAIPANNIVCVRLEDNGTLSYGHSDLQASSGTVNCYKTAASGAWTNTGAKSVWGNFFYEVA